jgi:crotonobetainyl-CoA:carnitine CoA-transferase CaiB-like acyl-CoA transferase
MPNRTAYALLADILAALDLPQDAASRLTIGGADRLPSCFPVSELAVASIGAAATSISQLLALVSAAPPVAVSSRLSALWFGWSLRPDGWEMPSPWDAIAGDYKSKDGWIKLHTNAPHHRAAALSVLGCEANRAAVAERAARWGGDALEAAIVAAGGCAARLRTAQDWSAHPQGNAVAAEPLILWDTPATRPRSDWRPSPDRPLAGLRVLDLTRVLAGPVATRFLAGFGADVLRIDPPAWDEPGVIPEVTLGKRCARLDLKSASGFDALKGLLSQADILVHGYRSDALENMGLGADSRQAIRPGLIDISLDAYGHSGPWAQRRGFDSLVQFSSGIAAAGMAWRGADAPVSLPVQALDHATGYCLAAAAVRAVIARTTGTGSLTARLSLARTAKLLVDQQGRPSDAGFDAATDEDFAEASEQTDWGPAKRLHPPVSIAGAPMVWDRAAMKLGSSDAVLVG